MERTRGARTLAERALALFALHLGDDLDEVTVIGGLNADLLTVPAEIPHQGTVDIDLFVQLGVVYDREEADFSWLARALRSAGFSTRGAGDTWRWYREIDGVPVRLELLCDVHDAPGQQIVLPGTDDVAAMNLAGPSVAANNRVTRVLQVHPDDIAADGVVGVATVSARFVDLGGYVLAKAAAVVSRGLDKDFYDLAYVLLNNAAGGPATAGRAAAKPRSTDGLTGAGRRGNARMPF